MAADATPGRGPRAAAPRPPGDGNAAGIVLVASPLARKIVLLNLSALLFLITGILVLEPMQDGVRLSRERRVLAEAHWIAAALAPALQTQAGATAGAATALPQAVARRLRANGGRLALYDAAGRQLGAFPEAADRPAQTRAAARSADAARPARLPAELRAVLDGASTVASAGTDAAEPATMAAVPIVAGGGVLGAAVFSEPESPRSEGPWPGGRRAMLQVSTIALLVALGLSLTLAGTIATPLRELAAAAEIGRDANARRLSFGRIRIPDLSARRDEIGRLSAALRGMLAALYARIETNERFASEVAHEVRNPLASLRSAVETLALVPDSNGRTRLLEIMGHDLRRLDRLMSDISDASRLERDLLREAQTSFDLLGLLRALVDSEREAARAGSVSLVRDLPAGPIMVQGLEPRLAQVFGNILANALSFARPGDTIRVQVRKRGNRVHVAVEDTGPGLPEGAATDLFARFYSQRGNEQFGEHSGLGLAIAKEIVDVHGGEIWAENIRPTEADPASDPMGARFGVALPL